MSDLFSGKKGMFVGYSKTLKAYRVSVLGQREVEIFQDVPLMKMHPSGK